MGKRFGEPFAGAFRRAERVCDQNKRFGEPFAGAFRRAKRVCDQNKRFGEPFAGALQKITKNKIGALPIKGALRRAEVRRQRTQRVRHRKWQIQTNSLQSRERET